LKGESVIFWSIINPTTDEKERREDTAKRKRGKEMIK